MEPCRAGDSGFDAASRSRRRLCISVGCWRTSCRRAGFWLWVYGLGVVWRCSPRSHSQRGLWLGCLPSLDGDWNRRNHRRRTVRPGQLHPSGLPYNGMLAATNGIGDMVAKFHRRCRLGGLQSTACFCWPQSLVPWERCSYRRGSTNKSDAIWADWQKCAATRADADADPKQSQSRRKRHAPAPLSVEPLADVNAKARYHLPARPSDHRHSGTYQTVLFASCFSRRACRRCAESGSIGLRAWFLGCAWPIARSTAAAARLSDVRVADSRSCDWKARHLPSAQSPVRLALLRHRPMTADFSLPPTAPAKVIAWRRFGGEDCTWRRRSRTTPPRRPTKCSPTAGIVGSAACAIDQHRHRQHRQQIGITGQYSK